MRRLPAIRLAMLVSVLFFAACSSTGPGSTTGTSNQTTACSCVEYPFPKQCDSQCGMKEFVVIGVDQKSKTLEVSPPNQPLERQTISLAKLPAAQITTLQAGSHIQILYKKAGQAQSAIKPLRLMRGTESK
jgi:hypothetical protein